MPTKAHQFIVDIISMRMSKDGYAVVAYEGESTVQRLKSHLPPKILRHRPDLIGVGELGVAVGEAKTAEDFGDRTKEQLLDFADDYRIDGLKGYRFFLGIPLSAQETLEALLRKLRIDSSKLVLITVPDRLLPQA
jgi:hypothetical protein